MFNKLMSCACADSWGDWGYLFLRATLGLVFFMHGWQKMTMMGIDGVTGFLTSLGFPMVSLFAYILTYGEVAFGLLMIVGLFTHWAAKYHVVVALIALFTVHISKGFFVSGGGYEFILLILAASVFVLARGGGKYSLDSMWWKKGAMM